MKNLLCFHTQLFKTMYTMIFIIGLGGVAFGATFIVTNTNDSGAGSLRQAIASANDTTAGDTINFNIPANDPNCSAAGVCTITLTGGVISAQAAGGELLIANQTGAQKLLISGNSANRIFEVGLNGNLTLDGLTVLRGAGGNTGVIRNSQGTLTINNSIITQNTGGFIVYSGAFGNAGTLNISNTTVSNNTGIGIFATNQLAGGGTVNIINSTVSNNIVSDTAVAGGNGGGIYFLGGQLRITNSTVSGNGNAVGGGIFISTFGTGGSTSAVLTNCTVTANTSTEGGGGIEVFRATLNLRNTIVSGNTRAGSASDIRFNEAAGVSFGNNLIGISTNFSTGNTQWLASDQLNQDARLAPLANNGGTTQTHALLFNSPAINAGNNCVITANGCGDNNPPVASDQRGQARSGAVDVGAFEYFSRTAFDFDGDGRAELSVFRPSNGIWYFMDSAGSVGGIQFGSASDKLVPANYDNDGRTDVAVYRNGVWYIQRSLLGFTSMQFGISDDIPVPADFDADGRADLAVYRPSTGTWYVQRSTLGFTAVQFGSSGDKPVAADFDGDGKADYAVFRPSTGIWYVQQLSNGFFGIQFGAAEDKLVVADYDGDGKADFAVFRPSNGFWYLQRSSAGFTGVQFGASTDVPVPADYDGDGKADIAVYRNDTWFIQRSTQGFTGVQFGATGDKPAPSAFVQ